MELEGLLVRLFMTLLRATPITRFALQ